MYDKNIVHLFNCLLTFYLILGVHVTSLFGILCWHASCLVLPSASNNTLRIVCCWNQVIAENLSAEEIHGLKAMFHNIDTDNSGTITYEELKSGLAKLGSKLTEAEVKQLMEAVSQNY